MKGDQSDKKERVAKFFGQLSSPSFGQEVPLFLAMGKRLVDLAEISAGDLVLDVAVGRGVSLFPGAKQVGQSGRITGIDIADEMVRETHLEIKQKGIKNAEMLLMDAENLEFSDASFDKVLCGFTLFFFPNLNRALSEFNRVLKAGGQLVLSSFQMDSYPWEWYEDMLKSYKISSRGGKIDKLVSQPMGTSEEITNAVVEAGFEQPEIFAENFEYYFKNEEAWWDRVWESIDRPILEKLSPQRLEALKGEAFLHLRTLKTADGIRIYDKVLFARAQRKKIH